MTGRRSDTAGKAYGSCKLLDPCRPIAEVMAAPGVRRAGNEERIQQVIGRGVRASRRAKAFPESDKLVPNATMRAKAAGAALGTLMLATASRATDATNAVLGLS